MNAPSRGANVTSAAPAGRADGVEAASTGRAPAALPNTGAGVAHTADGLAAISALALLGSGALAASFGFARRRS